MTRSVAVAVITYRRPGGLRRLLTSLAAVRTEHDYRVIVVDNDPDQSADSVVREFESVLLVEYSTEGRAGIPFARNRCLQLLRPTDDVVIFVDDDEWVPENWIDALVGRWHAYKVDIVAGQVLSVFHEDIAPWIVDGGYIQRPTMAEGSNRGLPATNNTLVDTDLLRRTGIRFDERLAFSGGSDSHFFFELVRVGGTFVWTTEGKVWEEVPADRAHARWIWRRAIRNGNVRGDLLLRDRPSAHVAAAGAVRFVGGFALSLVDLVRLQRPAAPHLLLIPLGVGMMKRALGGRRLQEYAR